MKVLKATPAQYIALNGYENNQSVLQFVKDANDNWIIGKSNLSNPDFIDIHEDLLALQEIDWNPPQVNDE